MHPKRLISAYASVQLTRVFFHEETLHPWQSKMCQVTILIRLGKCAGWSESALGTLFCPMVRIPTLRLNCFPYRCCCHLNMKRRWGWKRTSPLLHPTLLKHGANEDVLFQRQNWKSFSFLCSYMYIILHLSLLIMLTFKVLSKIVGEDILIFYAPCLPKASMRHVAFGHDVMSVHVHVKFITISNKYLS